MIPDSFEAYDVVVVGAGFAGCVMAERFASAHGSKVLIIDRRSHLGGNCYDEDDGSGIRVHRYGPHLFHTDNTQVMRYLERFAEWIPYTHRVKASIDGNIVPLPFNFNTIEALFPREKAISLQRKLLEYFPSGSKVPILELVRVDDGEIRELAGFIYEKLFVNYTAKQWGMKPEEIDAAVTARVPVLIGRDDRYFQDRYQCLPREGYAQLFRRMVEHPRIEVALSTDFCDVGRLEKGKIFLGDRVFRGRLIFTGALDELFGYRFGALPYRSVDMVFERYEQEFFQEAATVNFPNEHAFTRITEFKHIHPCTCDGTTILKEYPGPHRPGETVPYYPVFTEENREIYARYAAEAERYPQMTLIGRLAEYRYYDMDDVTARALELFERFEQ